MNVSKWYRQYEELTMKPGLAVNTTEYMRELLEDGNTFKTANIREWLDNAIELQPPENIELGNKKYKISYVEDDALRPVDGSLGGINPSNQSIYVVDTGDRREDAGTFLHELLHAIVKSNGLYLLLAQDREESEEELVSGLESGLMELFQRNPKFLPFLLQELNASEE